MISIQIIIKVEHLGLRYKIKTNTHMHAQKIKLGTITIVN